MVGDADVAGVLARSAVCRAAAAVRGRPAFLVGRAGLRCADTADIGGYQSTLLASGASPAVDVSSTAIADHAAVVVVAAGLGRRARRTHVGAHQATDLAVHTAPAVDAPPAPIADTSAFSGIAGGLGERAWLAYVGGAVADVAFAFADVVLGAAAAVERAAAAVAAGNPSAGAGITCAPCTRRADIGRDEAAYLFLAGLRRGAASAGKRSPTAIGDLTARPFGTTLGSAALVVVADQAVSFLVDARAIAAVEGSSTAIVAAAALELKLVTRTGDAYFTAICLAYLPLGADAAVHGFTTAAVADFPAVCHLQVAFERQAFGPTAVADAGQPVPTAAQLLIAVEGGPAAIGDGAALNGRFFTGRGFTRQTVLDDGVAGLPVSAAVAGQRGTAAVRNLAAGALHIFARAWLAWAAGTSGRVADLAAAARAARDRCAAGVDGCAAFEPGVLAQVGQLSTGVACRVANPPTFTGAAHHDTAAAIRDGSAHGSAVLARSRRTERCSIEHATAAHTGGAVAK